MCSFARYEWFNKRQNHCCKIALLFFILFIVPKHLIHAQQKSFRLYTASDGLINNHIQSVFQDGDGFMWFASFGGISIYDGNHFTNYTVENEGLADNIVFGFFKRSNDETWVIESSSTEVFVKRNRVKTIPINGYELSNYLLTKEGRVLVSRDNHIYEIKNAKPQNLTYFPHGFSKIFETGNYFLIESDSLFIVSKSFDKILGALKGRIFKDSYNRFWILDKEFHLLDTMALQEGSFKLLPAPVQIKNFKIKLDEIKDFLADPSGVYWLMSITNGVIRIDKNGNARIFSFNLNNLITYNFMQDAERNIWMATDDGVMKFYHNFNDFYSTSDGLPVEFITGIAQDEKFNSAWVVHRKGISCIYQNHVYNFSYSNNQFTWAQVKIQNDSLWVANNGLYLYKIFYLPYPRIQLLKKWEFSKGDDDFISCLQRVSDGSMLMNEMEHGLYRATKDGQLQLLLRAHLFTFLFDENELWTGGEDDGVARWKIIYKKDSIRLQLLKRYQHLPDDHIRTITKDSAGNFWVGTLKKGILKFEKQKNDSFTIKNYYSQQGLVNGWVMKTFFNPDGSIAVGTLGGLFELHTSPDTLFFKNLSSKYGVIGELNDFDETSMGSYWLATAEGVIHISTDLYNEPPPPKIFFTKMLKNNQSDSSIFFAHNATTFSHKENNLSFEFSATSFRNEDHVLYSYALYKDKDSSQWSIPQKIHTVSLVSLSPGSYTLKVKALTQDNVWSESPAQYSFIINSPFWSTWWFRTLIVMFVAAIVAGFYKFRLNQLRKVMVIRAKISRDLHDEIGSTLSGIGLMSEMVKEQMENKNYKAVKNSVDKISTSSEEILGKMSDIVWAINPQNDTFEKIINRLKTYATGIAAAPGIHLHFDTEKDLRQINLGMQQRNNIYLICKEAINNAIKYSGCSHLHFALRNYEQRSQIEICDDGKGFDVQQIFDGNGLKNMQSRADEIKATLSIESEKNKGTFIKLQF